MRQTISGLVAAIAVMAASAVPAMACGTVQRGCSPCGRPMSARARRRSTFRRSPTYYGCNTLRRLGL